MFNPGSVFFVGVSNTVATFGNTDAENGLSVEGSRIVLGQSIGTLGDPAQLLNDREIPSGAFIIDIREGAAGAVGSDAVVGITADNSNGKRFAIFLQLGQSGLKEIIHGANFDVNCEGCVMTNAADVTATEIGCYGNGFATVGLRNTAIIRSIGGLGAGPNVAAISGTTGFFSIWNDVGATIDEQYRFINPVTVNLDFPNTLPFTSSDLNVVVLGARDQDQVALGVGNAAMNANSSWFAWVSANDQVTVRFNNYSAVAIDPAAADFKVGVIRMLP